jgi:hypothetical protein
MLMKVGVRHYSSAAAFIVEALAQGPCKRLPGFPTGAVPNVTKIFLAHPRAIAEAQKGDVDELLRELRELAKTDEAVGKALWTTHWHHKADLLAQVYASKNKQARALLRKYGVKFHVGIFGYYYLAQLQGVVDSEDADIDEEWAELGVVPIFVVKEGDHGL